MADFTKTVTNSIQCFSLMPPSLWNSFNWGTGYWGYSQNSTVIDITKFFAQTIVTGDAIAQLDTIKVYNNIIQSTNAIVGVQKQDAEGYYYTAPDDTTELLNRSITNYTEETSPTTVWTEEMSPTTSWSET